MALLQFDDDAPMPLTAFEQSAHADAIAEHLYEATKLRCDEPWRRVHPTRQEDFRKAARRLINSRDRDAQSAARAWAFMKLHEIYRRGFLEISSAQAEAVDQLIDGYEKRLTEWIPRRDV